MEMRGRERKPEGIDSQKKCKRITGKKKDQRKTLWIGKEIIYFEAIIKTFGFNRKSKIT